MPGLMIDQPAAVKKIVIKFASADSIGRKIAGCGNRTHHVIYCHPAAQLRAFSRCAE